MKHIWIAIVLAIALLSTSFTSVQATSQDSIPNWVKGVAGWWAEGKISNQDFQQAIQFLVNTGVIKVSNATSVINDLQTNAQISFSESNQTTPIVAVAFDWNEFDNSSMMWQQGKISDSEFFQTVQAAINAGEFGPFQGPQNETGKVFQELVPNNTPATHEVPFSQYYNGGEVTAPVGDTVEWINDLNATHTLTSGTKITGEDSFGFDRSLDPNEKTAFAFAGPGNFTFYSKYGWDNLNMTVHVIPYYQNVNFPSVQKQMLSYYANNAHSVEDVSKIIEQMYRLGFVNNY